MNSNQKQHENLNKVFANKSKHSKEPVTATKSTPASLQHPAVSTNANRNINIPMDKLSPRLSTKNLDNIENAMNKPEKNTQDNLMFNGAKSISRVKLDDTKQFQYKHGIASGYSETSLKIPNKFGSSMHQTHNSRRPAPVRQYTDDRSLRSEGLSASNSESTINFRNNDGEDSYDDEKNNLTRNNSAFLMNNESIKRRLQKVDMFNSFRDNKPTSPTFPFPKSNFQAQVYNFLERPTGWKCFIYHFTV